MTNQLEILESVTESSTAELRAAVLHGMSQPQKHLPCKYFYDERGCELFDQICELPEYYPTRTELAILRAHVQEMADEIGPRAMLVEYGSGSSLKTQLLLENLDDLVAYMPVDIARAYLEDAANRIARQFPDLEILPVCADFLNGYALPNASRAERRRVVYFPGSTIGNLETDDAFALLKNIRAVVGSGGGLLIGLDLQKDVRILEAAYNDGRGVTAEFNRNLLQRMNRELDSDFCIEEFKHEAFYCESTQRIEMHLVSQAEQRVSIGGREFSIAEGETLCTEYSHKYNVEDFAKMASSTGFDQRHCWTDEQNLFAVMFLEADN
jgi:dimethylhistidine N-methyltransferase